MTTIKKTIESHALTNSRTISIIHAVIILTQFVTCLSPTAVVTTGRNKVKQSGQK